MIGMLRPSGNTWRAGGLANRRGSRYHQHWHRLVTILRHALLGRAPHIADQSADDGEVFALQCAEGTVRAEFNDVMEAWASHT